MMSQCRVCLRWVRGYDIRRSGRMLSSAHFNMQHDEDNLSILKEFIHSRHRLVSLTGAGVSTRSGIPDYRGPQGSYTRGHKPMDHFEFITKEASRKRYWSRSYLGYRKVLLAEPNSAHYSLCKLEEQGILHSIVTQNVDGLHQKAGSRNVIDLHGRIDSVICLNCNHKKSRSHFQNELELLNPTFGSSMKIVSHSMEDAVRPDGDVDLGDLDISSFCVPDCDCCGGVIKPNFVFFGDSVPNQVKQVAMAQIESSDGLLVVGSSLEVFSAFRLVRRALELSLPIVVLNSGVTRLHRYRQSLNQKTNDAPADAPSLIANANERNMFNHDDLRPTANHSEGTMESRVLTIDGDCCDVLPLVV